MNVSKNRKRFFIFFISVFFCLSGIIFFLYIVRYCAKKEDFIEIKDYKCSDDFLFITENVKKNDIEFYNILNKTEKMLLSSYHSSIIYLLNNYYDTYEIKDKYLYKILDICKTMYFCSDKIFAPILNNDIKEIQTNKKTNFGNILLNKQYIKKLNSEIKLNLDPFIDACCIEKIVKEYIKVNNFYIQKGEEIFVSGNQNKLTKGWNLLQKIKVYEKEEIIYKDDIEESNINYETFEKLYFDMVYFSTTYKDFDFAQFFKKINNNLLYFKFLKQKFKSEKTNITEKNKNDYDVVVKLKSIKNKSISIVDSKNVNKMVSRNYGLNVDTANNNYLLNKSLINNKNKNYVIPKFIIAYIFSDDQISSSVFAKTLAIDNFKNSDEIINKLRYSNCQYFVLYLNDRNILKYKKSDLLKIKKVNNIYEISMI